jgi:hypothetical protein
MIKEITVEEVKNKLSEFGLEYEDHGNTPGNGNMWVQYESERMMMVSLFYEVMDAESVTELIDSAEWYSCCGSILDHDVPLCTTCGEWC